MSLKADIRVDPCLHLPPELLVQVLDSFTLRELVPLSRLNTHWRIVIHSHPTYWTTPITLVSPATHHDVTFFFARLVHARSDQRTVRVEANLWILDPARARKALEMITTIIPKISNLVLGVMLELWVDVQTMLSSKAEKLESLALSVRQYTVIRSGAPVYAPVRWNTPNALNTPILEKLALDGIDLSQEQWQAPSLKRLLEVKLQRPAHDWLRPQPPTPLDLTTLDLALPVLRTVIVEGNVTPLGFPHGKFEHIRRVGRDTWFGSQPRREWLDPTRGFTAMRQQSLGPDYREGRTQGLGYNLSQKVMDMVEHARARSESLEP